VFNIRGKGLYGLMLVKQYHKPSSILPFSQASKYFSIIYDIINMKYPQRRYFFMMPSGYLT